MGTEAEQALDWVERCCCQLMPLISQVNRAVWTYAEPSGQEYQSAALLVQVLREYGFSVEEVAYAEIHLKTVTTDDSHLFGNYSGGISPVQRGAGQSGGPD